MATIVGDNAANFLEGSEQNDVIISGSGNDSVLALAGDDVVTGGDGDDSLKGDGGNDVLFGENGNDTLDGGFDNDSLLGGDGNDVLDGSLDNDSLAGGAGDDLLEGSLGDDVLFGDAGNDTLQGSLDNDFLEGGAGDDLLEGSFGQDTLSGGFGADIADGNADEDTYFYSNIGQSTSASRDMIAFDRGTDKIDLSAIDAMANSPEDEAFEFVGAAPFSNNGVGQVRYDTEVNLIQAIQGFGDFNAVLEIESTVSFDELSASDFVL